MTRHSPARYLLAVLAAAGLAACGGGDTGVDESAAQAGISSAQDTGDDGSGSTGSGGEDVEDSDDDGGAPGGPGGDPEGNGGGGDDGGEAEGNPGAPGDVAVFEEAGVTFGDLRNGSAQEFCVDQGLCTLGEPEVVQGDPDEVGGVDECLIREKTDIRYDPPARDGRFPEGATVTARVDCSTGEDEVDPEEGTPDEGTPDEGTPDEGTPDEGTPDEQSPDDGTSDGTPDDPGTDTGTEDQPAG